MSPSHSSTTTSQLSADIADASIHKASNGTNSTGLGRDLSNSDDRSETLRTNNETEFVPVPKSDKLLLNDPSSQDPEFISSGSRSALTHVSDTISQSRSDTMQELSRRQASNPSDIPNHNEGTHQVRLSREKTAPDRQDSPTALRRRLFEQSQTNTSALAASRYHTNSVPDLLMAEEKYLLKVCRGLMMYGAPTHRLEEYMHMTAQVLEMPLQSFYMPGCMIVSFNDAVWRATEVHIVRCVQGLNLAKLDDVHAVYKDVIHGRVAVEEANMRLDAIMAEDNKFPRYIQVLMYGVASAFIGPVSYGARPIDLPIIFILGSLLGVMELIAAPKSELYAHVFEISSAIVTSFIARAFGSIRSGNLFCFSAISQASLVLILPGFTITTSALELQSKNIVSGSVRMVYGIIYTLFLAFGIAIGTTIYGAIDKNATSATTCQKTWPFWWQVTFVAPFTLCYVIINQAKWSKMPVMIVVTVAGWIVNYFSSLRFSVNPQIPQALGALTAGVLANLYSRLGHGLAVAILHPAIFIQVPGSLAATGSLISGVASADEVNNGTMGTPVGALNIQPNVTVLNAGYAMIEIAVGITVGLSISALLIYPFRNTKGKSGLFSL